MKKTKKRTRQAAVRSVAELVSIAAPDDTTAGPANLLSVLPASSPVPTAIAPEHELAADRPTPTGVLGAYDVRDDIAHVLDEATTHVLDAYVPPNLGVQTRRLVMQCEPHGWQTLSATGQLMRVVDGRRIVGAPVNEENHKHIIREATSGQPICIFGLGLSHVIHVARSSSTAPVLVFEPDPREVAAVLAMRITLPGVTIVCTYDDFAAVLQYYLQGRTTISVLASPEYVAMHPEEHAMFNALIKRLVDAEQVTINTITLRMPEWIEHVIANLPKCAGMVPAMTLAGKMRGVPAVIVGAGPSLEKNRALLPEALRKCLVLTIDVAAGIFEHDGLLPHGIVTVEARDLSPHLEGRPWLRDVPKLFSLQASPKTWEAAGCEKMFPWADSNFAFIGLHNDVLKCEGLPIGGSVTTACFLFAEALGCDPIIMVGQDLANTTKEGVPYAEGVVKEKQWRLDDQGQVEAWGGDGTVTTAIQWDHAREWFCQRAISMKERHPETRLYNCTEGGSHINGFEDKPFAEVLGTLPEQPGITLEGKMKGAALDARETRVWMASEAAKMTRIAPAADAVIDATLTAVKALQGASSCQTAEKGARKWSERMSGERAAEWLVKANAAKSHLDNVVKIAREALDKRMAAEEEYRKAAATSHLFTGYTQRPLRELNLMRSASQGKDQSFGQVARAMQREAIMFRLMAKGARQLLGDLRGQLEEDNVPPTE